MDPGSVSTAESKVVGDLGLYAEYTSGATGAIPATLTRGAGFTVARTGTGVVVFTMTGGPPAAVLQVSVTAELATPGTTAGGSVITYVASASAGTVTVTFRRQSDWAATDTTTSDIVRFSARVQYKQPA